MNCVRVNPYARKFSVLLRENETDACWTLNNQHSERFVDISFSVFFFEEKSRTLLQLLFLPEKKKTSIERIIELMSKKTGYVQILA
jgi:hypothetical protein